MGDAGQISRSASKHEVGAQRNPVNNHQALDSVWCRGFLSELVEHNTKHRGNKMIVLTYSGARGKKIVSPRVKILVNSSIGTNVTYAPLGEDKWP